MSHSLLSIPARLPRAWLIGVLLAFVLGPLALQAHGAEHAAAGLDADSVCEICALGETASDLASHTPALAAGVAPRAMPRPRELNAGFPLPATGARDPPRFSLT